MYILHVATHTESHTHTPTLPTHTHTLTHTHTRTPVWCSLAVLRVVRKYLTCDGVGKRARLSTAHLVIQSAVYLSEV